MKKARSKTLGNYRGKKPPKRRGQNAKGQFAPGNQFGTASKQTTLKAGHQDPARRLLKDVTLHGTRSVTLAHLTNGDAVWAAQLREWKDSLVVSLGGWDNMNVECHEILAQLSISKVIVDSLAAYALANAPINKQKHRVFPWVMERDRLLISYIGLLRQLRETVRHERTPKDLTMDDIRRNLETDGEGD